MKQQILRALLRALVLGLAFAGLVTAPKRARALDRSAASNGGTPFLLPNGSFEAPAVGNGFQYMPSGAGWTFGGGAGISGNGSAFTGANPNAPVGSQVLFLQGVVGATASTSVNLPAGLYSFSFYAAQRANFPSTQSFQIKVDGVLRGTFTPSGAGYQSFGTSPAYFGSGSHVIELIGTNGLGDHTAFIDGLSATRTRELKISGFESPAVPDNGFMYRPTGNSTLVFTGDTGLSRNGSNFTGSNPPAPEASQVAFLQNGSLSVSFPLAHAGYYRVRFKAALRANNPIQPPVKNVRVAVASTPLGEFPIPNTSYTEQVSLAMYLAAGTVSVTLTSVSPVAGDHTAFVDDLRLEVLHDWADPSVWGGGVPGPNDAATVPAGSTVCIHGAVNPKSIAVSGELVGVQNQGTDVTTKHIMVMGPGSRLELGQDLAPYPVNATFTLNATTSDPDVMGMGKKFIGAMNQGTIHLHGENRVSWTQLANTASVGSTSLLLKAPVDWRVGDRIVVVPSGKDWNQVEERTLTAVNGSLVSFSPGLAHPHIGKVKSYTQGSLGRTWIADLRAEVGLLTHNIKVQGQLASPSDRFGGHIMIMDNSYAYVGGVELSNMGQEAILGRYPFHWHLLSRGGSGQYFKNSSVHHSFNRAVTIHGTDFTTVENNFLYDHVGHGLFLEDGSERYNVIRKNVVLITRRPQIGKELTPSDNQCTEPGQPPGQVCNQAQNRTPASYWITNPENTFEDNVAAGTEGTGYWFAFPQRPTGDSANDPRFANIEPYKAPLISFKRNSAHSTMQGFDIFDQLDANHAIVKNLGWAEDSNHYIDSCTWYANETALYTGIGLGGRTNNLIFDNNIFVENVIGTMFASNSIVQNSVFVADSGENLLSGERIAYRVYDGPGQIFSSYFVGWNANNANFLANGGAATKHLNHLFNGNVTDTGSVRIALENYDIKPPAYADANHIGHPRFWSMVLRDTTGGISGKSNTSIVSSHPFALVGDEFRPSNWTHVYRSDHKFALSRVRYPGLGFGDFPNITCTREKPGTASEPVYYIKGDKEHHQLPVIVNENYEYTYAYETLPGPRVVEMNMEDASAGDRYVARFKGFGMLPGLSILSSQGSVPATTSLSNLRASVASAYFVEPNGDLYIKAVAPGPYLGFSISWSNNVTPAVVDSDGDGMGDGPELAVNRDAFSPGDLKHEFDTGMEGWSDSMNIANLAASNGALRGVSANNGDATLHNPVYNFQAQNVRHLFVTMTASQPTGVEFFFATDSAPGYSAARRVTASHSGGNVSQTLMFDMRSHPEWRGTITDLRLDPVSGIGISFAIDRISAWCATTDGDQDGVCDFADRCAVQGRNDDRVIGTSCNDGNPATFPDAWSTSCVCGAGTF